MTNTNRIARLLAGTALAVCALAALPAAAQTAPATNPDPNQAVGDQQAGAAQPDPSKDIVVVGSQIKGSRVTTALPVTVFDARQIDATGAVSGDDLIRAIPQMGEVSFNPSNNPQTSNAARGDVNSINLRNLGTGNTLVLLNGRRMVNHPVSQAQEGTNVPVLGYNSNALPVAGIERLEILRDGAAAIYGSDAVAGVVNTVTRTDYYGLTLNGRYGYAQGTHRNEWELYGLAGHNFASGRGNVTLMLDYTRRTAQLAEDEPYTATADLRSFFAGDPNYGGTNTTPDGRATQSPWANLAVVGGPGTIRRGTTAVTSSAGAFHTQSILDPGCVQTINADTCLGTGTRATTTTLRNERFDTAAGTTAVPGVRRFNGFLTAHYDVSDKFTLYTELGYYRALSHAVQPPTINLNAIVIPASNYYNPFGPVTFANGQANPNRIPGLTNVPVTGLPVTLSTYRFVDTGPQNVDVINTQSRFLLGARGKIGSFDFDTAVLYSEAQAIDRSDAINMTKLQAALALSTPDAYNPFNGGCSATPSVGDCNPSSEATINTFLFKLQRKDTTTLLLGDFKLSNAHLFALPGGDVGLAMGVEGRRETQRDERDPNLNGTIPFTDAVTGAVSTSNVAAVSPTPSTYGSRVVGSAFAELAVPLVSPDMNIPLVRRIDLQLAGRYEHYSDFGSIAKPKIAGAWDLFDGLRLRGSYSMGFRAPNLEQLHAAVYSRLGTNTPNDFYRCEADLRAGRITTFTACNRGTSYSIFISGNPQLKPENSTDWTVGTVLQPRFIPSRFGKVTFTVDFWSIRQTGIVGQFGAQNAIVLDYLMRLQGASNPNVIRAAPTADDAPVFAGSGLATAGQITRINDQFVNLLPQTVQGLDLAFIYSLHNTALGSFDLNINAAKLTKYTRQTPPAVQALFDARSAGTINVATPLTDASNLLAVRGKPRWRVSGSLTWDYHELEIGVFGNYVGTVYDTNFLDTSGNPFVLEGQTTFNVYGQYSVKGGPLDKTRFRIGVRNLFDKQPPISADGYLGSLYTPYGRYWYFQVGKRF
ncbi:TonB-dependent receptor [Sphingomonas sp. AR_OL41]|uniref:TonB-dependent receptor domain-containing protein n=1 Tax=Sphingomonas sp. AR_OL41 TaxID=3042729 RepID=UPI00247FE4AB|nr:TonB-dependent receptor [Sphingomonas sp. AR_OL41]MDH7970941.1 TonB-dependent receptor [Sphingomonas sp. AR_OL41]